MANLKLAEEARALDTARCAIEQIQVAVRALECMAGDDEYLSPEEYQQVRIALGSIVYSCSTVREVFSNVTARVGDLILSDLQTSKTGLSKG